MVIGLRAGTPRGPRFCAMPASRNNAVRDVVSTLAVIAILLVALGGALLLFTILIQTSIW
jgi:hypothetical protein